MGSALRMCPIVRSSALLLAAWWRQRTEQHPQPAWTQFCSMVCVVGWTPLQPLCSYRNPSPRGSE